MHALTELNADVEEVLSQIASWEGTIQNARDYEQTALFLQKVKGAAKRAADYYEEDRDRQYRIYQAVLVDINNFTKPLAVAEAAMKTAITRYHRAITNRVVEAEARGEQGTAVIEAAFPDVKGISLVEGWKHEVVDPALIPREYLSVDEKKIAAAVKQMKGLTDIPGVKVERDYTVRSKSL